MGSSTHCPPHPDPAAPEGSAQSSRECCCLDRADRLDAPFDRRTSLARICASVVPGVVRHPGQRGERLGFQGTLPIGASEPERNMEGSWLRSFNDFFLLT